MRQRAAYVLGIELAVEGDRGVDRFHDGRGTPGEAPTPHLVAGLLFVHRANRALETSMANGRLNLPAGRLIAAAAIAGVLAGGIAVYVSGHHAGNGPAGLAAGPAAD